MKDTFMSIFMNTFLGTLAIYCAVLFSSEDGFNFITMFAVITATLDFGYVYRAILSLKNTKKGSQ